MATNRTLPWRRVGVAILFLLLALGVLGLILTALGYLVREQAAYSE
jgi:hypothetical protein